MTEKAKKDNEPELIEDAELDETSGGLLPTAEIQLAPSTARSTSIDVGIIQKAGGGN
jgi:hypothetical protein